MKKYKFLILTMMVVISILLLSGCSSDLIAIRGLNTSSDLVTCKVNISEGVCDIYHDWGTCITRDNVTVPCPISCINSHAENAWFYAKCYKGTDFGSYIAGDMRFRCYC